jgi:hypothetical protein
MRSAKGLLCKYQGLIPEEVCRKVLYSIVLVRIIWYVGI